MDARAVHERIVEFSRIRPDAKKDEIAILEVALFVEDVFGLILSDQEICEENLGTHQTTEKFALEKLNLA